MNAGMEWMAMTSSVFALAFLLVMAVLGERWRRQRASLEQRLAEALLRASQLERDVGVLCGGAARMGDRVVQLEQALRRAMEWQSQLELRSPMTEPLSQARALVGHGASADDLVAVCGVSRGEAELMARFRVHAASRNGEMTEKSIQVM